MRNATRPWLALVALAALPACSADFDPSAETTARSAAALGAPQPKGGTGGTGSKPGPTTPATPPAVLPTLGIGTPAHGSARYASSSWYDSATDSQ